MDLILIVFLILAVRKFRQHNERINRLGRRLADIEDQWEEA